MVELNPLVVKSAHLILVLAWIGAVGRATGAVHALERSGDRSEFTREAAIQSFTRWANPLLVAVFALGLVLAGRGLSAYLSQPWFVAKLTCAVLLLVAQVLLSARLRAALSGSPWPMTIRRLVTSAFAVLVAVLVISVIARPWG